MSRSAVTVSAPGKVLFAGGFLVLDRKHTGLVFGLDARIHVHIQSWQVPSGVRAHVKHSSSVICVQSPQFHDATWLYVLDTQRPQDDHALDIEQVIDLHTYTTSRNKFVEVTLQYVLTYLGHISKDVTECIRVTILADDDYYSQSLSSTHAQTEAGFTRFGVKLSEAHKTGLGSSAALVTALVSSLFVFYTESGAIPPAIVHNLAQAAHCAAQGKVGSGFDVAAAVFGSCLYRRFTPAILEGVGDAASAGFGERLHRCVADLDIQQKWDVEVLSQAVQIPDDLLLLMCDVDCGSETPGMVRKVLQWRKEKAAEADLLWSAIQQGSEELCRQLRHLTQTGYMNMQSQQELGDTIQTIRSLVREMSQKSGVPIEPDVITELLDYCTSLPGVVGGVAPGAGGYDAIALLIRNDVEVLRDLQARLEGWTTEHAESQAQIGRVRLLNVRQGKQGIRSEKAERYNAWLEHA